MHPLETLRFSLNFFQKLFKGLREPNRPITGQKGGLETLVLMMSPTTEAQLYTT